MSLKSLCSIHPVTIYSITTTRGAAGGKKKVRAKLKDSTCRIQPISARESAELAKEGMRVTHRLYFDNDPTLNTDHEIDYVDGSTTLTLEITGHRNIDFLGRLWTVDCQERKDVENT